METMSQAMNLKELFKAKPFEWIPVYTMVHYSLQYNARIHELRRSGMNIKNKTKNVDGKKHSWYQYLPEGNLF